MHYPVICWEEKLIALQEWMNHFISYPKYIRNRVGFRLEGNKEVPLIIETFDQYLKYRRLFGKFWNIKINQV